jgi:hypothetical protein
MFHPADMNSFVRGLVTVRGPGGGGESWKMVHDLSTEDFIKASNNTSDCFADLAKLVQIIAEKETKSAKLIFTIGHDDTNVTFVCDDDYLFFVFCSGWSSLSPLLTTVKYSLSCEVLSVGDICLVTRERKEIIRRNKDICNKWKVDVENVDDDTEYDNDQPTDLSIKK